MKNLLILGILLCGAFLSACAPVGMLIGAGAMAGTAAMEERGIGQSAEDLRINTEIQGHWMDYSFDMFQQLNITVREGRVLVVGFVKTPEDRLEAIKRIWRVPGVVEVINEIRIDDGTGGIDTLAQDTAAATEIKARMTLDKNIYAINYAVDVVRGVVYIMGIAQNEAELTRVIALCKGLEYVKQVKQYARIKSRSGETS